MSIIFDALKKSQSASYKKGFFKSDSRQFSLRIVLETLFLVILLVVWMIPPQMLIGWFASPQLVPAPIVLKQKNYAELKSKLVLNGIFLSDQKNQAMINSRMAVVGDEVSGMRIVSIRESGVELSDGVQMMKLKLFM